MAGHSTSRAIKDFLAEAEEIIERLNLDLVALGEEVGGGEPDPDLLNSIFRGAHSLKGLSGMFGFDDICELGHQMENLLDSMRLGKLSLSEGTVNALFDAMEALAKLVSGKGVDADFTLDVSGLIGRIEALQRGEDGEGKSPLESLQIDPAILNVLTEYEEHRLLENLRRGRNLLRIKANFSLTSFDSDLAEITDLLKTCGEVISTLPCADNLADRIAFQILVGTDAPAAEITTLLDREEIGVELLSPSAPEGTGDKAPETVQTDAAVEEVPPRGAEGSGNSLRSISQTVRVDIEKLDLLMNVVGELVLSKGTIGDICDRLKQEGNSSLASELQKATRTLERRLAELQKGVMEVRMVPVSQLFEKMIRIIRRVSAEQGKKVALDIRGGDTELDKLIMEDLADPLMHIIRNAIDHGVESAEERRTAGKPEQGRIALWASQKGNHVVIEVRDDGRGIDTAQVRRKAVEKGLVPADAEMGREEIFDLLFQPGFSTRDQVSDLSGRGVGMDVVKNNIAALSGMIELESTPGQGTTMAITLPITLAIIKALIVRVGAKTYAIPVNSVMETLMLDPHSIRTIERREVIELRQSTLPLLRLDAVFAHPEPSPREARAFVAVVGLADKKVGLVVDELLGQQDVVIKSLGNALSFVRGIAGAAELGNQKTILVLDVGGLMSEALRGEAAYYV